MNDDNSSNAADANNEDTGSLLAANAACKLMLRDAPPRAEAGPRTDLMDYWNNNITILIRHW